jgi:hypothetical protein
LIERPELASIPAIAKNWLWGFIGKTTHCCGFDLLNREINNRFDLSRSRVGLCRAPNHITVINVRDVNGNPVFQAVVNDAPRIALIGYIAFNIEARWWKDCAQAFKFRPLKGRPIAPIHSWRVC